MKKKRRDYDLTIEGNHFPKTYPHQYQFYSYPHPQKPKKKKQQNSKGLFSLLFFSFLIFASLLSIFSFSKSTSKYGSEMKSIILFEEFNGHAFADYDYYTDRSGKYDKQFFLPRHFVNSRFLNDKDCFRKFRIAADELYLKKLEIECYEEENSLIVGTPSCTKLRMLKN